MMKMSMICLILVCRMHAVAAASASAAAVVVLVRRGLATSVLFGRDEDPAGAVGHVQVSGNVVNDVSTARNRERISNGICQPCEGVSRDTRFKVQGCMIIVDSS